MSISGFPRLGCTAAALALAVLTFTLSARAQDGDNDRDDIRFYPNHLVLSRSVYDNLPGNVIVGQLLPPDCPATAKCPAKSGATNDGTFPYIFNNAVYDASFGITSRIYLDQITPWGYTLNTLEIPNSLSPGLTKTSNQLVTSFSSKSELGLHLSLSGKLLTFMGYAAPVNALDVSNSNTPGVIDPTNPAGLRYYRVVATVDRYGNLTYTETNAYSGNNGRSAILNDRHGQDLFYTAGNAGNGKGTQPPGILLGAGAQFIVPSTLPEYKQTPGTPTPLASFNITELGQPADKVGKDDNFRGMTIHDNVVYYTKGSGGNGVNTVYFVDTVGTACPSGVGLPVKGAKLPTSPLAYTAAELNTTGLPSNMCILAGFPTGLAAGTVVSYPFGLWFADNRTLYVADEGDDFSSDSTLYTHAAAQSTAGLQKWVFDESTKTWNLAYTLQSGLGLGVPYTVTGYPTGDNSADTNLPWAPATDGLRNITGTVSWDGSVIIWGITSTVSGSGDQGADPNRLVAVRDRLANKSAANAAHEKFVTLRTAGFAEVLRGISFTPGSHRILDEDGFDEE